jgi:hypothetical protein
VSDERVHHSGEVVAPYLRRQAREVDADDPKAIGESRLEQDRFIECRRPSPAVKRTSFFAHLLS